MFLQNVINHTELKFPNFKRIKKNYELFFLLKKLFTFKQMLFIRFIHCSKCIRWLHSTIVKLELTDKKQMLLIRFIHCSKCIRWLHSTIVKLELTDKKQMLLIRFIHCSKCIRWLHSTIVKVKLIDKKQKSLNYWLVVFLWWRHTSLNCELFIYVLVEIIDLWGEFWQINVEMT